MIGLENPLHILILLLVVLLVFGAKRLPEMGQSLGAGLRGFKDAITGEQAPSRVAELNTTASDRQQVSNAAVEPAPSVSRTAFPLRSDGSGDVGRRPGVVSPSL